MTYPPDPISESESDRKTESEVGSNERTNERTDASDTYGRLSGTGSKRARAYAGLSAITLGDLLADDGKPRRQLDQDEAVRLARLLEEKAQRRNSGNARGISEIIDDYLDRLEDFYGQRWPVVRSGERTPIPWVVRLSVYRRDDFNCLTCVGGAHTGEPLVLDHCLPWSAGGPDDSDNLRTLCWCCNETRSNFIDSAHATNYRPTTWWCTDCWVLGDNNYRPIWKDGTNLNRAPRIDMESDEGDPLELVYCAWCRYFSFSNVYFAGTRGLQLAALCTPERVA